MFRIIELKKGEFLHDGKGKEIATTEKEFGLYGVLKLNGKFYEIAVKGGDYLGVREFTPLNKEKLEYEDFITCPYCGYKDNNSWEKGTCGEIECSFCGVELEFETEVTVQYHIGLKSKPNVVDLDEEGEE